MCEMQTLNAGVCIFLGRRCVKASVGPFRYNRIPTSERHGQERVNGMEAKPATEQSAQERQIRAALDEHWRASASGDVEAEHDIYEDDSICDYPQSGERILGRRNLQALRSHHPGRPAGFQVKRISGSGNLWVTEYTILYGEKPAYTVSIMEFRDGKVFHETQYFADPFAAPDWRKQWVQQGAR